MLKFSIVTPCLNSASYIQKNLESVNQQSYPHVEQVVIDGGSKDGTVGLVEKHGHRVETLVSEPDDGIFDAFNKGVLRAKGDVILILNSDDCLAEPEVLTWVAEAFEKNDPAEVVYGNILELDPPKNFSNIRGRPFSLDDFKTGDMCPHPAFFARRELLLHCGLFDLRYKKAAADFDLVIKCFLKSQSKPIYLPKTLSKCLLGGYSTDYTREAETKRLLGQIIREHFQVAYEGDEINGLCRQWLENLLLQNRGITSCLKEDGVEKVAIFGVLKLGRCLKTDCEKAGLHVAAFLDNNPQMQGKEIDGVPVISPSQLHEFDRDIQAILLSLEGPREGEVKKGLEDALGKEFPIHSWREVLRKDRARL